MTISTITSSDSSTSPATLLHRILHEMHSSETSNDDSSSSNGSMSGANLTDPAVFWAVNAFIVVLLLAVCGCFCYRFKGNATLRGAGRPGSTESDQIYQRSMLQRRQAAAERQRDTPEERRTKLLDSWARHGVRMVVAKGDVMDEIVPPPTAPVEDDDDEIVMKDASSHGRSGAGNETSSTLGGDSCTSDEEENDCSRRSNNNHSDSCSCDGGGEGQDQAGVISNHSSLEDLELSREQQPQDEQHHQQQHSMVDVEMGIPCDDDQNEQQTAEEQGQPVVPQNYVVEECETGYLTLTCQRQVPNCCAVCLCPYEVGEEVIWSSNQACQHAFHKDCILDWLTNMRDGTPCPCCRQEFTDLDKGGKKERIVEWAPVTFNQRTISFR